MRALFSDKNFRIGLSHAINRAEIIELSYEGTIPLEESTLADGSLTTRPMKGTAAPDERVQKTGGKMSRRFPFFGL